MKAKSSTRRVLAAIAILLAALTPRIYADELVIPLDMGPPRLKTKMPRDFRSEKLPDGGIRFIYTLAEDKSSGITLTYQVDPPVNAHKMIFELKQAQAEKLWASCVLQDGKQLGGRIESQGPEFSTYILDLDQLASDQGFTISSPVVRAEISFKANSGAGEQTVEIRKWWLE